MFKKKIISSILALGLVTLNITSSNANTRIKQLEPPPANVVLHNEISTDKTTTYNFGNWVNESGQWYYYVNGVKETSWRLIDGNWYYLEKNGSMAVGWKLINGNWYYLQDSGAMAIGWRLINGNWYYLEDSGAMAIGWRLINGNWYYLEDSGAMAIGWRLINGNWYYLEDSGAMAIGWRLINGNWYYLEDSGAMAIGWRLINGNWYYLEDSGAMAVGWKLINGNWYYMYDSGIMAKNTIIDGWKIDSNGIAKKNPEVQNHAPTVTANNVTINQGDNFNYSMLNAKATDKDGDKVTITYDGTVKTSEAGKYPITVIATDEHGAKGTVKVVVTVKEAPVGNYDPNSSEFKQAVANQMYSLVANHRKANGSTDLIVSNDLAILANKWSKYMADNNFFNHVDGNGNDANDVFGGHEPTSGENIAATQLKVTGDMQQDAINLANELFAMWKNSSAHNASMLSKYCNKMGFGFHAKDLGENVYTIYATQEFGYQKTKSVEETPVVEEQAPQTETQPQVEFEDTVTEPTVEME